MVNAKIVSAVLHELAIEFRKLGVESEAKKTVKGKKAKEA